MAPSSEPFLFPRKVEGEMKNKIPKYAHLEYQVLHELEISIQEYFLLDMIYRLSRGEYCNKRIDNIAYDMRMTRMGVMKMRDRLIERGLLKKGIGSRLTTTEKVNKVYILDESELPKSKQSLEKSKLSFKKSKQSFPKNNNRLTKNIEMVDKREKPGQGYKLFQQQRKMLSSKLSVK